MARMPLVSRMRALGSAGLPARRAASRWLWRRRGLSWQLPSGLHARVESLSDWVVYNEIFVDRVYDDALDRVLAMASPDRPLTVLDLGANVGYFSLRAVDRVRQLGASARATFTLLEGHPATFRELEARWRQQPLDARTEVRLVHGLAGQRAGVATISDDDFRAAAHVRDGGTRGTRAAYVDLDHLVAGPIDLLKCDIEGAEAQVIEEYPLLLARVACAAIELHPRRVEVDRLVRLLADVGLTQQRIVTDTPDGSLRLFVR
jgi:FkbM family methyltransferase